MAPTRRRFFGQAALVAGGVAGATGVGGRIAAAQGGIDPAALDALRGRLQGRLVVPGDETFDRDRRVFYTNPRTETKPAVIVQCGHADDVPRAVEFARRHGLELAVRSGGHSHLAWGSSGGLVIDLAPLRRIAVDPARRIVAVDGGVLGGDVAAAAGKHGLAPVLGQCPGVGAAGVTLGGGLGWLSGLFGACCDSLLSASIVTADGSSVEADAARDPDLLWGLQGVLTAVENGGAGRSKMVALGGVERGWPDHGRARWNWPLRDNATSSRHPPADDCDQPNETRGRGEGDRDLPAATAGGGRGY